MKLTADSVERQDGQPVSFRLTLEAQSDEEQKFLEWMFLQAGTADVMRVAFDRDEGRDLPLAWPA